MVKICTYCGAKNEFDSRFCSKCGSAFEEKIEPKFTPVKKAAVTDEADTKVEEEISGHFIVASGDKRFWAYLIDLFVTSVLLSAIIGFAGIVAYGNPDVFTTVADLYFETFIFGIGSNGIILFLYFVITEYFIGSTIGKSILGIKVIDEYGRPPALVPVIINSFGKSFAIFFDVILGWFFVKYEEDEVKLEQRLFQKLAKIVVIDAPKTSSQTRALFTNR